MRVVLARLLTAFLHGPAWPELDPPLDLQHAALKKMIARARLDRMREAGAGIVRKYSRDPVVERRERTVERRRAREAQAKDEARQAWKAWVA